MSAGSARSAEPARSTPGLPFAAFLLSDAAAWMTGELVVLDGGVILTRER